VNQSLSHDHKQILNIKYKKGLSCLNEVGVIRGELKVLAGDDEDDHSDETGMWCR
jgi:hypothetical protein